MAMRLETRHLSVFQSVLPRRERLAVIATDTTPTQFQSTLPRREQPGGNAIGDKTLVGISIRAPAKGATRRNRHGHHANPISIHAPAKESDTTALAIHTCRPDFNPRSHEGSDHPVLLARHEQAISIRAPAKGATFPRSACSSWPRHFNPRSREGSDPEPS